jgi:hypothetical protein
MVDTAIARASIAAIMNRVRKVLPNGKVILSS